MGTPLRHAETQNGAGQEAGTNRFWERHRAICAAQEIADPRVSCLSMITQTITRFPKCIRCEEEREKEKGKGERTSMHDYESPENSLGSEFRSAREVPPRGSTKNTVLEEDGRCSATRARAVFRASLIVETFRDGFYPSLRVGRVIKSSAKVRRTPNALRKIIKRSS